MAKVGAPWPGLPIASPSLPTIWANPWMMGCASATPSTASTVSTADSGMRPRCVPPRSVSTLADARTTASVSA